MRTLFLQMFVAFWFSTIGIFLVATALNPDGQHGSLENILAFAQRDAAQVNAGVVAVYHHEGCSYQQRLGLDYVLLDASGHNFCGAALPGKTLATVAKAVRNRRTEGIHDGDQWVTAAPIDDAGHTLVVVHRSHYQPRPWIPHLPIVALPVSLLVTFLFAFLLTIPVRALSQAFREFSAGNLATRLTVRRGTSSGWGGSDVRSLMLDFNRMADRVNSLIDAQKMLVRDISHELRSPLARLRLALEMAREEKGAPLAALDRMEAEADRVNDLIGQMLTLSLMESTQQNVHTESVDLRQVLDSLLPDMDFEAASRPCTIRLETTLESCLVNGNSELLRSMIENVVRNAIRFTARGSEVLVRLQQHASSVDDGRGRVTIAVADRGPGIAEEHLEKVFRAFFRTDTARNASTGGYGLGLSIADRAARLHQGTITAGNRRGGGLEMIIRL